MESNVPSFFEHNMCFDVIPMRYVFKLIGFSPKDRPKMGQFFEILSILNKKIIFLPVLITINILEHIRWRAIANPHALEEI